MLKRRWMADATLLTFWPPAPCARMGTISTSFSGSTIPLLMTITTPSSFLDRSFKRGDIGRCRRCRDRPCACTDIEHEYAERDRQAQTEETIEHRGIASQCLLRNAQEADAEPPAYHVHHGQNTQDAPVVHSGVVLSDEQLNHRERTAEAKTKNKRIKVKLLRAEMTQRQQPKPQTNHARQHDELLAVMIAEQTEYDLAGNRAPED